MTAPCPFCSESHPAGAFVCPKTQKRLAGIVPPGTVIDGKYRIVGVLGTGGMAAVYRAEHLKIGRTVALKLLLPEYVADPDLTARVEREARAGGSIDHPNVAAVTDLGRSADFGPYIAMELLKGEDLAATLERNGGKLPAPNAVAIVRQVLSALEAAHARGVVHRDLKPENVFMVPTGDGDASVKVLDFGISKVASEQGAVSSLTRTGTVMGTPQYMAPEQAAGAKNQDARVDVYATGVLLYELLTGKHPHEAENFNLLMDRVLNHPPTPLAQRDPTLDPSLVAIVMRAVESAPRDRFQSVREMLDALTAWSRANGGRRSSLPELAETVPASAAEMRRAPTARATPEIATGPQRPALDGAFALALDSARAQSEPRPDEAGKPSRVRRYIVLGLMALGLGAVAIRTLQPGWWKSATGRLESAQGSTPPAPAPTDESRRVAPKDEGHGPTPPAPGALAPVTATTTPEGSPENATESPRPTVRRPARVRVTRAVRRRRR